MGASLGVLLLAKVVKQVLEELEALVVANVHFDEDHLGLEHWVDGKGGWL